MTMPVNPFAVLGLPEWPDLDDETVAAAWHAIAAETHPDRPGGGDLARYTQGCAAYTELRTPWGRSEAYADLVEQAWADGRYDDYPDPYCRGPDPADEPPTPGAVVAVLQPVPLREVWAMIAQVPARVRHGHPLRMLIRAAVIAGLCLAALVLIRSRAAAGYAVLVLAFLFVVFARDDLAPPPRRRP